MPEVISREVIGSANPIARFFRGLSDSIKGIGTGILFIIISFVLVGFAANQTQHSKTIAELPLQTPEEVVGVNGMVKIQGEPNFSNTVVEPLSGQEVLYYVKTVEDYAWRKVEKSRTVTENGQDITEKYVEYELDWKSVGTPERGFSTFSLGPIEIGSFESAKLQMNTEELFTEEINLPYNNALPKEQLVDVPQKQRTKVVGVTADVSQLIVVGVNSGDKIASGGEEKTFFVSNMTNDEFVSEQASDEKTTRWIMIFISWLLMASGFTMLFGPIAHLLNILPGLGSLLRTVLFVIFGIISALIVFLAYVGIKFWWLILLIIIAVIAFFVYRKVKKGKVVEEVKVEEKIVDKKKDVEEK